VPPRVHPLVVGWLTAPVLIALGALVALLLACPSSTSNTGASCPSLCTNQLACGQTLQQCLSECTALEQACNESAHPSAFQAYVTCATSAGFSCTDAGQPMVNASCGTQANDLQQCQVEVDGGFVVPDASLVLDMACPGQNTTTDPTGCLTCCVNNHPSGAAAFSAAVRDCTCGPSGACEVDACARETCAPDASKPQANDACDQCLTRVLNDQTSPPGVCLDPVTLACNKTLDCALYINCTTQAGCAQ
jgi:hypothetical protein